MANRWDISAMDARGPDRGGVHAYVDDGRGEFLCESIVEWMLERVQGTARGVYPVDDLPELFRELTCERCKAALRQLVDAGAVGDWSTVDDVD